MKPDCSALLEFWAASGTGAELPEPLARHHKVCDACCRAQRELDAFTAELRASLLPKPTEATSDRTLAQRLSADAAPARPVISLRRRNAMAAAAVLLAGVLGIGLGRSLLPIGTDSLLQLDHGLTLGLRDAKLTVRRHEHDVSLLLDAGEVRVAHYGGPTRTVRVWTPAADITLLGTVVRVGFLPEGRRLRVVVEEGEVRVDPREGPPRNLGPKQSLDIVITTLAAPPEERASGEEPDGASGNVLPKPNTNAGRSGQEVAHPEHLPAEETEPDPYAKAELFLRDKAYTRAAQSLEQALERHSLATSRRRLMQLELGKIYALHLHDPGRAEALLKPLAAGSDDVAEEARALLTSPPR